jgi:hypothetical protein
VHSTLPDRAAKLPAAGGTVTTPGDLATKLLSSLDPTTAVSLGDPIRVAGRTAYDLVVSPKSTDTLVGSISIAVDSETGLPLSVDVSARGQKAPAFTVGFTQIDLAAPDASLFSFTPPAGSKVTEKTHPTDGAKPGTATPKTGAAKPTVMGTGWDAVLSMPAGQSLGSLTSSPLNAKLTTPVAGGHVFHTSLANVLLTDDGRVFAGSVPVAKLQAAASK